MTKKAVDASAATIVFTFADGQTQTFEMSKVPAETIARLALHGASQKVGDSYAGAKESPDPLAYAKAAVEETIAQLYKGDWSIARSASGVARVSNLVQAYATVSGKTLEEAQAMLDEASEEEVKAIAKKPKIKAAIDALRLAAMTERARKSAEAAAKADADEAAKANA